MGGITIGTTTGICIAATGGIFGIGLLAFGFYKLIQKPLELKINDAELKDAH